MVRFSWLVHRLRTVTKLVIVVETTLGQGYHTGENAEQLQMPRLTYSDCHQASQAVSVGCRVSSSASRSRGSGAGYSTTKSGSSAGAAGGASSAACGAGRRAALAAAHSSTWLGFELVLGLGLRLGLGHVSGLVGLQCLGEGEGEG